MEKMPQVGFRFQPTEEELVTNYLQKKVQGESLTNNVIPECGIYNKEPWELDIVKNNPTENCFYAFTKRTRSGPKARVERGVGRSGTWKNQNKQDVRDGEGEVIGYRRLFSFKAKGATATNEQWNMHEFSLKENDFPVNDVNDFALCKISRNSTSSGSKHGQVKSTKSKAKRKRNDDEGITLQPQVENEDTSFQNPKLCEESRHPKNKQLISSLTEEAPIENDYIEDPGFESLLSSFGELDHPPTSDELKIIMQTL